MMVKPLCKTFRATKQRTITARFVYFEVPRNKTKNDYCKKLVVNTLTESSMRDFFWHGALFLGADLGRPLAIGEPGARQAGAGCRGGKEGRRRKEEEARWKKEIIMTCQGVGGKKTPTRACEVGGCGRV